MIDERRKRSRLKLRVAVLLLREGTDTPFLTESGDITTQGFYCASPLPLYPGEKLRGLIALPPASHAVASGDWFLEAKIEVVRLVVDNDDGFSIGCRIDDYALIQPDAFPSWAAGSNFAPIPHPKTTTTVEDFPVGELLAFARVRRGAF